MPQYLADEQTKSVKHKSNADRDEIYEDMIKVIIFKNIKQTDRARILHPASTEKA